MATGRVPTTANSPLTTKGDLFGYSTAPARLAVGSDGETIVADSSTATGLRYTAGTVQANPVLNSSYQVWQRGTSFAVTTPVYTADRWQAARSANASGTTVSRQVTGDTTNLPNIQYCARVQRDSGNTGTGTSYFVQSLETVNSIPYAGKTITYSFYARKGANYSATSSGLAIYVAQGTGTDQNFLTNGYTGGTNIISQTVTLTSTWQRFTLTGSVPSTATELGVMFAFDPTGTAGAADYYEVTGVQIDIGSVALPFRTYAGTIQGELAACQRYYVRWSGGNSYSHFGTGVTQSSTNAYFTVVQPVEMRVAPTALDYSTMGFFNYVPNVFALSNLALNSATTKVSQLYGTTSGATAQQFVTLCTNNSSSGFIGLSAEL